MARYLVDCNHLSEAIDTVSVVRDRIQQMRMQGHIFITCHQVLCELEIGMQQTPDLQKNRLQLKRIPQSIRVWPLTLETTQDYGEIYLQVKRKGRVLSSTDIVLAALARQHKLIILTTDRDFEALPDLKTENWAV